MRRQKFLIPLDVVEAVNTDDIPTPTPLRDESLAGRGFRKMDVSKSSLQRT
jgi:hypothetical protein